MRLPLERKIPFKHARLPARIAKAYFSLRTAGVRKFIFTATTGRSGTLALAELFRAVPGCASLHEPYPIMNGAALHDAGQGEGRHAAWLYERVKSINVRRAAVGHDSYFEANHLFVKAFIGHAAADLGRRLEVIHLVRDPIDVAMSIYRLEDEPGTARGNQWWLDHRAPANRIAIADALDGDARFAHPFYRCLWYCYEVEARIHEWRRRLPELRMHRFETEWLNDPARVRALMRDLDLPVEEALLARRIGVHENARNHQKLRASLPRPLALDLQDRLLALLAERGLWSAPAARRAVRGGEIVDDRCAVPS
jgi:hypothetical protein